MADDESIDVQNRLKAFAPGRVVEGVETAPPVVPRSSSVGGGASRRAQGSRPRLGKGRNGGRDPAPAPSLGGEPMRWAPAASVGFRARGYRPPDFPSDAERRSS